MVEKLHEVLGLGEAEAITFAYEKDCIVAIDDRVARKKANSLGLKVIGTIGILIMAKNRGLINNRKFLEAIISLRQRGFHISEKIFKKLIDQYSNEK